MTNATNEELAESLIDMANDDNYADRERHVTIDDYKILITEAARRVRLLDEYVPRKVPPTIEDANNNGVVLYKKLSGMNVWMNCRTGIVQRSWQDGDLWLPLPKVQE